MTIRFLRPAVLLALGIAAVTVLSTAHPPPVRADAAPARYLAPSGSDANPGTIDRPWRTLAKGLTSIHEGQTLYLRGGRYTGNFDGPLPEGSPSSRITVMSYPGEHATIAGLIWFEAPDYWTIRDLTFTWAGGSFDEHMVKVQGGTGWILENLDIYGSQSRAGLLIARSPTAGAPHDWVLRDSRVHDTKAANVYVNPGLDATNGLIEGNVFWNSPTENLKIGWGGQDVAAHLDEFGAANIVIRFNTLSNGTQPLTIAEPTGGVIDAYRNVVTRGQWGFLLRLDGGQGYLDGTIEVHDNVGAGAGQWCEDDGARPGCATISSDNRLGPVAVRAPGYGAQAAPEAASETTGPAQPPGSERERAEAGPLGLLEFAVGLTGVLALMAVAAAALRSRRGRSSPSS